MNFRGHTKTLEFGPRLNVLRGPNESGKSTVAEALAFVWFGTDAVGTKNPDHLISFGNDFTEVAVMTEHATVTRRKRRDATSSVKIARHGLPAVGMTQTELGQLMKVTLDGFMSCWLTGYFMDLTSDKKLAVLAELSQVDRKALLLSMLPEGSTVPPKVKLQNPKVDADAVASERRQIQNMLASDEGSIRQIDFQVSQISEGAGVDIDSYTARLNEINAELEAFDLYKRNLSKYGQEKMRYEGEQNKKGGYETGLLAARLRTPEEFAALDAEIDNLSKKETALKAKVAQLPRSYKAVPAAPLKPKTLKPGAECGTCGQAMSADHINKVMGAYEKSLLEYNKAARDAADHNANVDAEILKTNALTSTIVMDHVNKLADRAAMQNAQQSYQKYIVETKEKIKQIDAMPMPQAPTKPSGDEESLRSEQLGLNTALNMERRVATQLEGLRAQKAMVEGSVVKRRAQVDWFAHLEKALRELPGEETRRLLETLAVPGVDITLSEGALVIKDLSGIPYQSLSAGRRMKVNMAFCGSLRKAAKGRAPTWMFCDNADLMDRYDDLVPPGLQVFAAKVDGQLTEMTVIQHN